MARRGVISRATIRRMLEDGASVSEIADSHELPRHIIQAHVTRMGATDLAEKNFRRRVREVTYPIGITLEPPPRRYLRCLLGDDVLPAPCSLSTEEQYDLVDEHE